MSGQGGDLTAEEREKVEDLVIYPASKERAALEVAALLAAREAAARAEITAAVEALVDRWDREAADRGPDDTLYTSGVVGMLRAALSSAPTYEAAMDHVADTVREAELQAAKADAWDEGMRWGQLHWATNYGTNGREADNPYRLTNGGDHA